MPAADIKDKRLAKLTQLHGNYVAMFYRVVHAYECFERVSTDVGDEADDVTATDSLAWIRSFRPALSSSFIDRALPDPMARTRAHKLLAAYDGQGGGTAMTDSLFMTSRDGQNFLRNEEAFLRPGPERSGVWTYGSTYMSYGFAETRNAVTGDEEISLYATENYRYGPTALRRYTLRQDGFRSWSSPWK